MPSARDPVSAGFDAAARRVLTRAYAQPGTWVAVWLPDPTVRERTRYAAAGVTSDLTGPDNGGLASAGAAGGLDCKTRWARGFVRALNYQHKWYSPARKSSGWGDRRTAPRSTGGLRVQVGRHVPASPQFDPARPERGGFPPRRRVRVQLAAGGKAKNAAVTRLADRDRWATGPPGSRTAGPRWADQSLRDWA